MESASTMESAPAVHRSTTMEPAAPVESTSAAMKSSASSATLRFSSCTHEEQR
jgi:hypothetical protein